jgi:hypothetical protein
MAISYHGIIGNKERSSLGSVESWKTNNNIIKDPTKSITTRRIDKVNADGSINEMMYHTSDSIGENINVFARGVNPMVSVEYGNRNGGTVGNYLSQGRTGISPLVKFLNFDFNYRNKLMKEVALLLKLRHNHVVKIYETIETKKHIIIV